MPEEERSDTNDLEEGEQVEELSGFNDQTAKKVATALNVKISRHYESSHGNSKNWELDGELFKLTLIDNTGILSAHYRSKEGPRNWLDIEGITLIDISRQEGLPSVVRFERASQPDWALLVVDSNGGTSMRSK